MAADFVSEVDKKFFVDNLLLTEDWGECNPLLRFPLLDPSCPRRLFIHACMWLSNLRLTQMYAFYTYAPSWSGNTHTVLDSDPGLFILTPPVIVIAVLIFYFFFFEGGGVAWADGSYLTGERQWAVWVASILAPKLTSRACALRVCSPPAAIAVTQAISQTLICKALRIDSPPHAQMNKQRHKTWSFCFKYHILSKSNKIQRQVGGIFHLWQFLLDQIAHGR